MEHVDTRLRFCIEFDWFCDVGGQGACLWDTRSPELLCRLWRELGARVWLFDVVSREPLSTVEDAVSSARSHLHLFPDRRFIYADRCVGDQGTHRDDRPHLDVDDGACWDCVEDLFHGTLQRALDDRVLGDGVVACVDDSAIDACVARSEDGVGLDRPRWILLHIWRALLRVESTAL